jgi:methionyl-tRNA formyltransferase
VAFVAHKVFRQWTDGSGQNMRLIVLTSDRFGTASNSVPTIHDSASCSIIRVVISRGKSPNRWRLWLRKSKKTTQIGLLGALNGIRMRKWYHTDAEDLKLLCERLHIPVFETDCTNSDLTTKLFKDAGADLGLSLGNSYISPSIFTIPKYGMINVHGERLPEYKNAQSVIWPIYNCEMTTGLTIHQIERSIDTGKILYAEEYPIVFCEQLSETVRKTVKLTQQKTAPALRYVCENYHTLLSHARTQGGGRKFTTPTIQQFYRMTRNNTVLYEKSRTAKLTKASTSIESDNNG